jgi:hypothetical protein
MLQRLAPLTETQEYGHAHQNQRLYSRWGVKIVIAELTGNPQEFLPFGLLERLSRRNEFLIESHHPLRETLILQTGHTVQARQKRDLK